MVTRAALPSSWLRVATSAALPPCASWQSLHAWNQNLDPAHRLSLHLLSLFQLSVTLENLLLMKTLARNR